MVSSNFGVTTWTLPCRGIDAIRWAAANGFGLVHIDANDLGSCKVNKLASFKEMANDLGVVLAGLSVNRLEKYGLVNSNLSQKVVKDAITCAQSLDIKFIYLPSFGEAVVRSESDFNRTAFLLKYALELTHEEGMYVATENNLSADRNIQLLGQLQNVRGCLLFDTQNPTLSGLDAMNLLLAVRHLLGPFVHVKDGIRRTGNVALGLGDAKVASLIKLLVLTGYRGSYILENDYRRDSEKRAHYDQTILRRLLDCNKNY